MITFNTLLRDEGIDPADVKLVRHQDTRWKKRQTPYERWRAGDGRFELYQSIQGRPRFNNARLIASFVGTPLKETLFVGLYAIQGVGKAAPGLSDPISHQDVGGRHRYQLKLTDQLTGYRGKLTVDWGESYRSWVQRAAKRGKPVMEIRRAIEDDPFPGFLEFRWQLSNLAAVPQPWRGALSSIGGVYVLISEETGEQYVGSAYGAGGFWARWEEHANSGSGRHPKHLRDAPPGDYQVTILEVAPSSAGETAVIDAEQRWKRKLLTREFGLNAN